MRQLPEAVITIGTIILAIASITILLWSTGCTSNRPMIMNGHWLNIEVYSGFSTLEFTCSDITYTLWKAEQPENKGLGGFIGLLEEQPRDQCIVWEKLPEGTKSMLIQNHGDGTKLDTDLPQPLN